MTVSVLHLTLKVTPVPLQDCIGFYGHYKLLQSSIRIFGTMNKGLSFHSCRCKT